MAWLLQGINNAVYSLKKLGHVRPNDFFRERTSWFIPWRSHDEAWHDQDSSELTCSSFPEEIDQGVSGLVIRISWIFQEMNHVVFPEKSGLAKYWKFNIPTVALPSRSVVSMAIWNEAFGVYAWSVYPPVALYLFTVRLCLASSIFFLVLCAFTAT